MIEQLKIRDFAIADNVVMEFSGGFNVITGETGAGKSIILSAISMALGDRADQDTIRRGSEEAVVEALFSVSRESSRWISDNGFPQEDLLIIRRVIKRNGKNRVFINGASATLGQLRQLTEKLIDLNNQNEHQVLMSPANHTGYLDYFGDTADELAEYIICFDEYTGLKNTYDEYKANEKEIRRKLDNYRFEKEEIDALEIFPGEDESIKEELDILESSKSIMEDAGALYSIVEENEVYSAIISEVFERVERLKGVSGDIGKIAAEAASAVDEFEGALRDVKNKVDSMDLDEERLAHVNERLSQLERVKRKYGDTLEDVLKYRDRISAEIVRFEEMTFDGDRYEQLIEDAGIRLAETAERLALKRREAAELFQQRITGEFCALAMERARFEVVFSNTSSGVLFREKTYSRLGPETAEFYIEANPGEGLHPLVKTASGGELSRILFALKSVISRRLSVECMIFDEIDNGIGGETAAKVSKKLQDLAASYQMIVITHQPQIAAAGESHFHIEKISKDDRTISQVRKLDSHEHIEEVARMIAGDSVDENVLMMAKSMCGA